MTYQITKLLMILAGTWQLELGDVSRTWKVIYKIYSFALFIPYHAGPIMFLLKFYQLLGVDNDKAVECLSMLITVILLVIKMTLCKSKEMTTVLQHSIEKVDEALENGNETAKSVYTDYMQFTNRLNILLTSWSFLVGIFLIIATILEDVEYLNTHETTNDDMPLQVLFWYPFPYYEHYKIVLGYQSFSVLSSDLYNSYLQALPNTIMTQIAAELKILQHNIKNFTRDDVTGEELSGEKAYFKLRRLIVEHQNTIDQIGKLNRALRMNLLIEYAVSSVMLASILVQIISGKKVIFNCIYFGALAFGWFMLSYNANEIHIQIFVTLLKLVVIANHVNKQIKKDIFKQLCASFLMLHYIKDISEQNSLAHKSTNISMALYESNWYKQDKRTNQLVLILLMRTQKPLHVQIGLFGPMTINAAISRFKLAYSYVSVMSP